MKISDRSVIGGYAEPRIERMLTSWCLQDRHTQKRWLGIVVALSVELDAIRKQSIFGTAIAEGAIEAVIQGRWAEAEGYLSDLSFPYAASVERYSRFVEILREACRAEAVLATEIKVAEVSQLQFVEDVDLPNGAVVRVYSLDQRAILERAPGKAPDGQFSFATKSGNGRWMLERTTEHG